MPFPNTAYARHTSKASKTVFIEGKPVMLKDKSYFSTSTGNEAATGLKGLMTRTKKGKAYFTSWSMDVKIEGYNVCRHMDGIDHNHNCDPANTPPWFYLDDADKKAGVCATEQGNIKRECGDDTDSEDNSETWKHKHCDGLHTLPRSMGNTSEKLSTLK